MPPSILIPLIAAGAAGAAVVVTMHGEREHKRKMRRHMKQYVRPPRTMPERCNMFKKRCHQYIDLTSLDKYDVHAKRRYLDLKLHDHIHRQLPIMLKGRASRRDVAKRCIGICEKVCDELHIPLKPRCEPPLSENDKYHAFANYAVNVFQLDYNHAPPMTTVGLGGRRSLI